MPVRLGINGFGRIGRITFRAMVDNYWDDIEVVAINDLVPTEANAHLLLHDTNYRRFQGQVSYDDESLTVNGRKMRVFSEREPAKLPWGEVGADIVIESTGFFTDGHTACAHQQGGAKKVVISAPAKNVDLTVVMGVNDSDYDPQQHHIISNASCTTNCLAPIAKVLDDNFGIVHGLMTTVHSYTNDQRMADQAHKDPRRARAGAVNIIPTSTGAARAISLVLPQLEDKLDGLAMRVPTPTGSIVDLTVVTEKNTSADEVNQAFAAAANGPMQGILGVSDEPLVSSDYIGDPRSSIVDALSTTVVDGNLVKVLSWYDNEWGYSNRLADLCNLIEDKGF